MVGEYYSRHHANHRKILALLIEEMSPRTVTSEDYERSLARLFRSDEEDGRNWKRGTIRTYATCLECFGDGCVQNPAWFDDEECREPEALDCETCRGAGLVEIVDAPVPVEMAVVDDDLPF